MEQKRQLKRKCSHPSSTASDSQAQGGSAILSIYFGHAISRVGRLRWRPQQCLGLDDLGGTTGRDHRTW